MSQFYFDPERANDPHALPDGEVFYMTAEDIKDAGWDCHYTITPDGEEIPEQQAPGWYWWACFPGCLPDSEAFGPFETEEEAVADAQAF